MRQMLLVALFLLGFLATPASAATPISEDITGTVTWTRDAGPYIVSFARILPGASLTIEPGTTIKVAQDSFPFIIDTDAMLTIGNNEREQVVITSIKDDTIGGDTNNDGTETTPGAGDWRTIIVSQGALVHIENTSINYGGGTQPISGSTIHYPTIKNNGGTLALDTTILRHSQNIAIELASGTTTVTNSTVADSAYGIFNTGGSLTVGNNTFINSSDYGIRVHGATQFTNNGGNRGGLGILMAYNTSGDQVWGKDILPYVTTSMNIPDDSSLTILPGVIVKATAGATPFYVDGTLTIGSDGAEQVIVTSITDDTVGGDTNGDGALTTPQAGDWRSIIVTQEGAVHINNAIITYGGATPYNPSTGGHFLLPIIQNNGGTLTIDHADLAHSGYYGILQNSGTTTITNSTLSTISKWGVYNAQGYLNVASTTFDTMERSIAATGGMLELGGNTFANTASYAVSVEGDTTIINHGGNTGNTGIYINQTLNGQQTLRKDGLVYVAGNLTIPADASLTILPGVIIKAQSNTAPFYVIGTLTVGSEGGEEVIVTSITDDTVGGDTNGDGAATLPFAGSWRSITLNPGSHTTITNTAIRYGGASPYNPWTGGADWLPMIRNNGGTLLLDHVTMTDNGNFALLQYTGDTTITHSEIARTSRYGIFLVDGTLSITDSSIHDNATYGLFNGSTNMIDATGNWWGSATGPTHPSNPGGTGDRVSDYVDFGNWLGQAPGGECIPGTAGCYSNVLFLPGLQASRLYAMDDSNCALINCENQLWEPNRNDDVRALYLDSNGKSTTTLDIYTRDVIDEINISGSNIYESFIAMMDRMKNDDHLISDWKAIPYDWRLSPEDILRNGYQYHNGTISYTDAFGATTTPYIIQELERLAATSRTGKVTIIAHSNGGLVAKALTEKLGTTTASALIDKIIFVAVPQAGTPEAIGALLHGYNQNHGLGFVTSPETARTFAENMPGAYNLLPSSSYFTNVTTPVVTFVALGNQTALFRNSYGTEIDSSGSLQAFLRGFEGRQKPEASNVVYPNVLNPNLLDDAIALHEVLDAWTPPSGVKVYQIAGWGNETLATIKYKQGSRFHCFGIDPCIDYDLQLTEDGDGTVVVPSALAMASSAGVGRYWMDLKTYNTGPTIDRLHADIFEVDDVRNLLQNIIKDNNETLPVFISTTPPQTSFLKRIRFFLHSPLSLDLYDALGNHTGISTTTGMLENHIPGAYYRTFGEVKYITAPAGTSLHLVLNGESSGYFTLDVQEVEGDTIINRTSFADLPTEASTHVTMDFTDGTIANAGMLNVDENGDGSVDFSLAPQLNDIVTLPKPKLTVQADHKTIALGAPLPSFTTTSSGFILDDTVTQNDITGSPSCTTPATNSSPAGTYSITCTQGTLTSATYDFTFTPGTLTITYNWSGFSQPINDTAVHPTQPLSVFKGGSTIPVKFQLKNTNGTAVQSLSALLFLPPQKGSAMSASIDESTYSLPATSGTAFKWDTATQQYIYNWSTKGLASGYWYRLFVKLDDGTIQSVVVGVR